jgi:hypothetical protein
MPMRRINVEYSSKYQAEYCTATFAKRVLYAYPYSLIKNKNMIQKFRKKPVEVEAIQWNGNSNKQEIEQFVGRELKSELESETAYVAGKGAPIFRLLIETKEGIMKAFRGDWIIKEPFPTGDRDFYPCKNDIFVNTYDVL